jgi:hypothetical protein
MVVPVLQNSLNGGEISPDLFGRTDLDKYKKSCSTVRNFFASYRGPLHSRAGTKFVGQCLQPGTGAPPVLIPFEFSLNQGIALEFGNGYIRFAINGGYVTESPIAITGVSNAAPGTVTATQSYVNGDWVYIADVVGMPAIDANIYIIANRTGTTFNLRDPLTNALVDTTAFGAYGGGGTVARIYTLATPYLVADLPLLKWTQSADVMTLTHPSYVPYDLARITNSSWTLTATTFASSIAAPASCTGTSTTAGSFYYQYVATAVDATTGEESVASPVTIFTSDNIGLVRGTIQITCGTVVNAGSYNFYKGPISYASAPTPGPIFGYVGTALAPSFTDDNIVADFTTVPPTHQNPFPSAGNYPGVAAYFQQRRFYAASFNNPDTFWASQPGAFKNMDTSIPAQDDDALIATPWAQQVNGIQAMLPMPGGLVILTGLGAWQLSGGQSGAAVTPSNLLATPQAYNGCAADIKPITINFDILYVQSRGSIVRDLSYNFFVNIYTGTDLTVLSNHLFTGHRILRWDWAEEPYKLVWAVREDGILLCLTYLKEQDVYAWTRHDTNGLFQSVCTISEPPVNAPYFIVKRLIQSTGAPVWAYFLERMDNRIWNSLDETWCVDAGAAYPQPKPNATLTVSSSRGVSTIIAARIILQGSGYVTPIAIITDATGNGAVLTLTQTGGAITGAVLSGTLTGYTAPRVAIVDTGGAGVGAEIILDVQHLATFTASSAVFGSALAGDVIRLKQGRAVLTSVTDTQHVVGNLIRPATQTIPNDPLNTPVPNAPGSWSLTRPVTTVHGLGHLEGMTVSILADGNVITPQTVVNGAITLPQPATAILAGLGFTAQAQTLYLDVPGGPTIQGRRKTIYNVLARVVDSARVQLGANQPDQSVQPDRQTVPWGEAPAGIMTEVQAPIPSQDPLQPFPLYTGDLFTNVADQPGFTRGQAAAQQIYPLPLNLLALIIWAEVGDDIG